jgi:phosphatidylglycerol---prolipoprotein diacylglyceryl transferase
MHPILFKIPLPGIKWPFFGVVPNLPIYSYGVMLGLSIVIGWYLSLGLAEKDGLPREEMANCYVFTALVAIAGSRLLYVATNLEEFHSVGDVFAFRRGGLVAYGGFVGGALGSWFWVKRKRIPLLPWGDVAVPSLATGLMVTRIGCYLFGCDFGKPLTDSAPGFLKKMGTFPHWTDKLIEKGSGSPAWVEHQKRGLVSFDSVSSLPVHPTQIYESLVGLSLFGLLMLQRKNQRFRGQVFLLFIFAYGVARYLLEILRDDAERGSYGPHLSEHIIVPGGLLILGIGYIVGISKIVDNQNIRIGTQIAAVVPALLMYLSLKPSSFADEVLVKLSTSQWVAVISGTVAAIFYGILLDNAKNRPKTAMLIDLREYNALYGVEEAPKEEVVEEKQEDPAAPAKKKKKRKLKSKAKKADPSSPETNEDDSVETGPSEPQPA